MGFSSQLVFGHGDRQLLEVFASDDMRRPPGNRARELWSRPGGWQTWKFQDHVWGRAELRALVEWSGAPACFAFVYGNDVAYLVGLSPGGRGWQAVLGLATAAKTGIDRPPEVDDDLVWHKSPEYTDAVASARAELEATVPAAAEAAIAWAVEAGTGTAAERGAIEAMLRSTKEEFVEDSFIALIDALGFPPAVPPASTVDN